MIKLSTETPFAIGGKRACYRHPEKDTRCIKVPLEGKRAKDLQKGEPLWKQLRGSSFYDENATDLYVFKRLKKHLSEEELIHFQPVFGFVETDIGLGLDVELVRSAGGAISTSGKEYVMTNGFNATARHAVETLQAVLLRNGILFRDPFPHNLAFQERESGTIRAIVIDGILRSVFPKSRFIFPPLAKRHLLKEHRRLLKGFMRTDINHRLGIQPKGKGMLIDSRLRAVE